MTRCCDSDLRIAALGTRPMVIEEIDSEEERQTRLRKKKETLGMDETMEIHKSDALRQVRVPEVPQIRSLSQLRHRSRSAQHLIWCCGVMSLVEYSNQLRKRGKPEARAFPSVRMQRRRPRTSSHTHKFPKLVQLLRASQSRRRSTSQTTLQRTRVPDHHG